MVKRERTPSDRELRFAKEDVLRFLRESGGSAATEDIVNDVGDEELVKEGIKGLKDEGLVTEEGGKLFLTEEGYSRAEEVYRIHKAAEELLKGVVDDPHLAAHSIEHLRLNLDFLTAVRERGVKPLTSLRVGEWGRVVAILNPKPSIISRVFGVGAVVGRLVRVIAKSYGLVIIEAGYEKRTAAIDAEIAKSILVTPANPEGGPGRTS